MTFKPVDHKVELQISQGIYMKCRTYTGKHVSIRCRVGGFSAWLHDIPFEHFCQGIRILKANTDFEVHTLRCPFCAEWTPYGGMTLAHHDGCIEVCCDRARAQLFLEYAEDFIQEVKEHIDAAQVA